MAWPVAPMNLRSIEVFRAIMRLGTVTAAADAIGSSQPTITRELLRMETQIGFPLFERKRRRLQPTARAKRLYQQIQATFSGLEDVNRLVERLRDAQGDVLTIATLPAFAISLLPEVLVGLKEKIPELSVDIQTTDPRDETPVSGYDFDIGLIEGGFANPAVEVSTIAEFVLVAVMPSGHPLAGQPIITPKNLDGVKLIGLGPNDPSRLAFTRTLNKAGVHGLTTVSCQSAAGVCELVASGMGVAVINPLSSLRYRQRGLVLRRFEPCIPFRISALRPLDRPRMEAAETFFSLLKQQCSLLARELAPEGCLP